MVVVENNYLSNKQIDACSAEMKSCQAKGGDCGGIIKKYEELSTAQQKQLISELYAIEDEIRGLPESERLAVRQQRSKVLLTSLHEWMVEKNGTLSKKSRLGEAFSYVLNQWDALCYYSDDGLAEADNNTAERALRAVCLGKKNSYDLCQILSPKRPYAAPGASLYRGLKNMK